MHHRSIDIHHDRPPSRLTGRPSKPEANHPSRRQPTNSSPHLTSIHQPISPPTNQPTQPARKLITQTHGWTDFAPGHHVSRSQVSPHPPPDGRTDGRGPSRRPTTHTRGPENQQDEPPPPAKTQNTNTQKHPKTHEKTPPKKNRAPRGGQHSGPSLKRRRPCDP